MVFCSHTDINNVDKTILIKRNIKQPNKYNIPSETRC